MKILLKAAGLAALLALCACGGSDKGAGGLTADEERALDNAAAMLDQNDIDVADDSAVPSDADMNEIRATMPAPANVPAPGNAAAPANTAAPATNAAATNRTGR